MQLKATIANGYRARLLLIAIGALLYASWAVYDAEFKYPAKIEVRKKFEEIKQQYPETWNQEWSKVAEANGWDPTKEPEELASKDITTQWVQFAITCPIGLYSLFSLMTWSRRFIACDNSGLASHGGVSVPFEKITRIDAARWENKGIAVIYYDLGQGEKSLILDDWKFERVSADQIFAMIREKVPEEKIHGLVAEHVADGTADAESAT